MNTKTENIAITVRAIIDAPVRKVWEYWTEPKHIIHWNNASDDWYTPRAENDLRVGGKFMSRMEARDGSVGFDFEGTYSQVEPQKLIEYFLGDDRKIQVHFDSVGNKTSITEMFDAESENSLEMQEAGWQSILNNFKKYTEKEAKFKTLYFKTEILAKPEKVFNCMTSEKTYNEWTSEFNPTSGFKGSWEKGSKILFLGTDEDGSTSGMTSRIKENIPNRYLSIEHLGVLKGGKEITAGPEVEGWSGATENYIFEEQNGNTLLTVELDSTVDFLSYFNETWPKALKKLKEICER
jgi:uncharacterized protein YndB with AHSA1/START domain